MPLAYNQVIALIIACALVSVVLKPQNGASSLGYISNSLYSPDASDLTTYTDTAFHFLIDLPSTPVTISSCSGKNAQGLYALSGTDTSLAQIFDDTSSAYLSTADTYQTTGISADSLGTTVYQTCIKVTNSLSVLTSGHNPEPAESINPDFVIIHIVTIATDADLSAFVKKTYDTLCSVGAQSPTVYPGTVNVALGGANGAYCGYNAVLKYSATKHQAATWTFGPENGGDSHFSTGAGRSLVLYDQVIQDSFRFE